MQFLEKFAPHVHWGIRLSLAGTFLVHGYGKFPVDSVAGLPTSVSWMVALGELAAGVLIVAGYFMRDIVTRLAAALIIVIMLGAIAIVHLKNGWNVYAGGMEFAVLMLACGLYFLVKGNRV